MEYINVLDEGQDLVEAAKVSRPTFFRERDVQAAVAALSENRSVLLVGPAGVGKTSVLHDVVRHLGGEGALAFRRFTTAQIMSGTRYLGDWQSKLTRLMTDAEQSNAVLS